MRLIPLTKGEFAKVDDEDYEVLSQYRWHHSLTDDGKAYVKRGRTKDNPHAFMHRMILNAGPGETVDHCNGDGLDNQKRNLRLCLQIQNGKNVRRHRDNTSGYKGVSWSDERKKWACGIGVDGQRIGLGRFDDVEEAAYVYDQAAIQLHGEFAQLNVLETLTT